MDNEFNNALIKMFCSEKDIEPHFTTAHSHTGNSDIERFHLTLLEHIRILNAKNENYDTEEMVITAVGHYNNTIHSMTGIRPMDFINKLDINIEHIKKRLDTLKKKHIDRINEKRETEPKIDQENLYTKNPEAVRNKIAKRFVRRHKSNPNKIDIALVKRPRKLFTDNDHNAEPRSTKNRNNE